MASGYTNEEREKKRMKFARERQKGNSISDCAEAAGIHPSTFYDWDGDKNWKKEDGWSKDDVWPK